MQIELVKTMNKNFHKTKGAKVFAYQTNQGLQTTNETDKIRYTKT